MLEDKATAESQVHLLHRIAARDLSALEQFYDQTSTPLFSVALRVLGDAAEAEEVIQDVFVQIWEKAAMFDAALGSAFHWALSIARHRAIDRVRARQRRARLVDDLQTTGGRVDFPGSTTPTPGLDTDDKASILSALGSLPADQRQAIEMAFFGGKTHHEIAAELGEPVGTIKARIRRGMLKMRESLQEYA
jgi:RNA polymerase sigma-70 factor (ECF subfamily)